MKLSEKQIAEACGVSLTTVSRVLNHKGRISQQTRERILNYVEQQEAKQYAQSFPKKMIGLIVPNVTNEYYSTMVTAIENNFYEKDYDVLLYLTKKDIAKKRNAFDDLIYRHVSGIIYIGGPEKFYHYDDLQHIPLVSIEHSPLINHQSDCLIHIDHDKGGYIATEKLIQKGCQRLLFLGNHGILNENKGRYSGYLRALKDYHLAFDQELIFKSPSQKLGIMESKNAIHYLLTKGITFDGIFATNDWRAYGVMAALKDLGISIPEQIQVIGYDDITISRYTFPSLSTIHIDYEGLALLASNNLHRLINHEIIDAWHSVPITFVKRDSTK